MKIAAYEVREDEREMLERCAGQYHIHLSLSQDPFGSENAGACHDADGITTLGKSRLDAPMLEQLAACGVRAVCTRTVGYDHIDLEAARRLGLHVFHASYDPDGVAEFTIMLMLMSLRNYKQALYRANANDYSLSGLLGRELRTLTVGVMGTGAIGARVIELLSGFGCKVLAYNRHGVLPEKLQELASCATINEIYHSCDVISLHLPLTDSTKHIINREAIGKMKTGVVLINCARGGLMSIEDLIWGIETQKIGALGMDVVEQEDGIYHRDLRSDILSNRNMAYIRQFPNVTMTQHMAFYTDCAVQSMAACGIRRIADYLLEGKTEGMLV